ncbi:MAG: CDP-glycerol glycerophosphotransferase family protein [Chloroflexota bacterium]
MGTSSSGASGARPVLFVAREPDETLRTFLPVIDSLHDEHRLTSRVLFHHTPGAWARDELATRGVPCDEVTLTAGLLPRRLATARGARTVDEVWRLRQARELARAALARHQPSAVVVIQDTLLLERFLVRAANEAGLPTLVVQWAFSYPQTMYDRLRTIQYARSQTSVRGLPRRLLAPLTSGLYRSALRGLGLGFDLVNSYGGGEAKLFAVMGEAFREQFVTQGVRGKRIVVTGHPTHDAVFRRAATFDAEARRRTRATHGLSMARTLVLYATQPVLWRKVLTKAALERNVRAMAAAVARQPGCELVLKLHPREDPADYAFCATLDPPVTVIAQAEMPELIAASDLFISSSSSTVLLAMMLDRPIVTVNFDAVPHFDQFEPIGGTLHVRTHAAFEEAIGSLLTDREAAASLAHDRARVVERYTRYDGHAAKRIANLIAEAGAAPSQRPKDEPIAAEVGG